MRPRREGGFTLIELLLTITIMGTISASLGTGLVLFLTNTDSTIRRIAESHDAQLGTAYFAQDVQSTGIRTTTSPYNLVQSVDITTTSAPLGLCGSVGTPVLRLGWDDPSSATASTKVLVSYSVQTVAGQRSLHRLVCLGGSTTATTDIVLVDNLDTAAPSVTCSTTCAGVAGGDSVPQTVTMILDIKNPPDKGATYYVTLVGHRRDTS
jgi:prepilin-type N-terminal cleavage/methylation domain-containing protein